MPAIRRIPKHVPLAVVSNAVAVLGAHRCPTARCTPSALWVARLAEPKEPLTAVAAWEKGYEQDP